MVKLCAFTLICASLQKIPVLWHKNCNNSLTNGSRKKKSTFGNDTSQAFTYDYQNKYWMNFGYFWSSLLLCVVISCAIQFDSHSWEIFNRLTKIKSTNRNVWVINVLSFVCLRQCYLTVLWHCYNREILRWCGRLW